ncbi:MAG: O-methyltransferase [Acidobacteria bacterium]|nr:MAG: O-methyltransferase [Acidobacteriota bacterium]
MNDPRWTEVDRYVEDTLVGRDEALEASLAAAVDAGLPTISVTPAQGKLLFVLAKSMGATRILELGTLAGYSAIWLARALGPAGRLITLEIDPHHADVARRNFARAGVADRIDLRVGSAHDTLADLAARSVAPFDLIFIDADKVSYAAYFAAVLPLSRPGTLILADNVIRKGAVADTGSTDANVIGARRFHEAVAREPRVSATAIQTVGAKGYDGFSVITVLE